MRIIWATVALLVVLAAGVVVVAQTGTPAHTVPKPALIRVEAESRTPSEQPLAPPLVGVQGRPSPAGEPIAPQPAMDPASSGTPPDEPLAAQLDEQADSPATEPPATPQSGTSAAHAAAHMPERTITEEPASEPSAEVETESPATAEIAPAHAATQPALTAPDTQPAADRGPDGAADRPGTADVPSPAISHHAPPTVIPDPVSTRSAMGLLANVMNQSQIAPGADFIGRLAAAAAGFWIEAPEIKDAVPDAARAFRIASSSGGADVFVADDGKGNNVTLIIPRPDLDLVHELLEQSAELALAPEEQPEEEEPAESDAPADPAAPEAGAPEAGAPETGAPETGAPVSEVYSVSLNGEPAGIVSLTPIEVGPGAGGLAIHFVGTTPIPAEALAAPGAGADVAFEVQEDGSIRLANGMVIQGQGTPEHPYAITWDLLVAAERVYQPRNGLNTLPRWCNALHEKHVRITGHLLSPLMMDDTQQILLMRNQWDGCCVGVPPTPYDAIEVELSRPVSLVREQLNYGTITGVFEVDPYLVNNWLVGLWILSEAEIEASGAQNWAVPVAPN